MTTKTHRPTEAATPSPGLFISFEGQEGAGKSTQMERLARRLIERGHSVLQTREPGGTELGEELRRLVKHGHGEAAVCPEAELLLMAASRAQLTRQRIQPSLAAGQLVLCDRFFDSTTAYQGYGRGLDLDFIESLHRFSAGLLEPDLTVLLDLPVRVGEERSRQRGLALPVRDRFESEERAFHKRVRDGFLQIAARHPERIRIVEADRSPAAVEQSVWSLVEPLLADRSARPSQSRRSPE